MLLDRAGNFLFMHGSLGAIRKNEIESRLLRGLPVNATALAKEFLVSDDAIRRDLRALAAEGKCKRVYGGGLPISDADFKRTLIAKSDRTATLVTMDKLETRGPFQVAALAVLDHVVLEAGTSEEIVSTFSMPAPKLSSGNRRLRLV